MDSKVTAEQSPDVIRRAAGKLFDERFRAAGWTPDDLVSYTGVSLRRAVTAIAAGGEAAAMREIISEHMITPPVLDPETGKITDPLLDRCLAIIADARTPGEVTP